MGARSPDEIWEESLREGERRLSRSTSALAATGFAGGADVFFSVLVLAVASGALAEAMPPPTAQVLASLAFGIGFVLITLGRAELFTENFLLPVGAVVSRLGTLRDLLRMWGVTLVLNFAGLALFAAIFSVDGVVRAATLDVAGTMADTLADRSVGAAFLSAVAAGTVMTIFTWVVAAAESSTARVVASLLIGFVLAAPALNHAVVGFGEIVLGMFAGTTQATVGDLARNTGLAIGGNFVGGVGLVFLTRLAQVRGEPGSAYGPGGRDDESVDRPGAAATPSQPAASRGLDGFA